jgi:hypothetical protein
MLYDKDESFSASSSSHYCTSEKLIIPITNHTDQLPISQIELTTNVGSHQISDLQIKGNHNRYGDKDDDQIFKLVCDSSRSATKVELPTFNTEISESNQQRQQHFSSQLKQQEYHFSPYKHVVSNYGEEQSDIFQTGISAFSWNNNKGRYFFGALLTLLLTTWSL